MQYRLSLSLIAGLLCACSSGPDPARNQAHSPAHIPDAGRPAQEALEDSEPVRPDAASEQDGGEPDVAEPEQEGGEPDVGEPAPDAGADAADEPPDASVDSAEPAPDASTQDGSASEQDAQLPPPLRYATDIAPILAQHCALCHVSGGAGPFSLADYAEVSIYVDDIQRVTSERIMPPCEELGEPCGLSDEQIERIGRWVQAGALR